MWSSNYKSDIQIKRPIFSQLLLRDNFYLFIHYLQNCLITLLLTLLCVSLNKLYIYFSSTVFENFDTFFYWNERIRIFLSLFFELLHAKCLFSILLNNLEETKRDHRRRAQKFEDKTVHLNLQISSSSSSLSYQSVERCRLGPLFCCIRIPFDSCSTTTEPLASKPLPKFPISFPRIGTYLPFLYIFIQFHFILQYSTSNTACRFKSRKKRPSGPRLDVIITILHFPFFFLPFLLNQCLV